MKFLVNVDIEESRWTAAIGDIAAVAERVKNMVADVVLPEVDILNQDKTFAINLCLSNDKEVHRLNYEFRGMDKPTNVLSFANMDDESFEMLLSEEGEVPLGDIIIAYETMVKEAGELDISLHDHFCHLWAHGLLHVLGYDHMEPEDAAQMESREIEILQKLNIANPYQE